MNVIIIRSSKNNLKKIDKMAALEKQYFDFY